MPQSSPYSSIFRLDGRVAVVVGGSGGGMGTETCRALVQAGARLSVIDKTEQHIAQALDALGPDSVATTATADVTQRGAVEAALDEIIAANGRVDILVNVAGGTLPSAWGRLEDPDPAAFDQMIELNLRYSVVASSHVARDMIARGEGGAIVNFGSVSARTSAPLHGVYGAAKAGLMAMTRTMAVEWAEHGIRVNCLAPGAVRSPRIAGTGIRIQGDAMARFLEPSEVAPVAVFLCSNAGSGITGQTLYVDAGVTARSPGGSLSDHAESARKHGRLE